MRKLTLLLLLVATFALHADDGAVSLSPAVVMLRGDYGQSTTQTLRLVNGTSQAFQFELIAEDAVVRDGKRTFVEAGLLPGSIAATAVFSQKQVNVAAGETITVTITVTLPAATEYRAVRALFRGTNTVMSGNVPVIASLGSLLTFSIGNDVTMTAAPLVVRPQSATANLAVSHLCTNSGREPFVAKGVMAILDAKGTLVGRTSMQPYRLLPGESAELGGEYAGELEPGQYRVMVTYDYEGQTLTRSAELEIP